MFPLFLRELRGDRLGSSDKPLAFIIPEIW
jgi:hypothetical protein